LKKVWAIILAFLLVVGVLASVKVFASILAILSGGNVTVGP